MSPSNAAGTPVCRECGRLQPQAALGDPCPAGCAKVLIPRGLAQAHPNDPHLGTYFGDAQTPEKYAIFDLLGRGSFGAVYCARASNPDREVAIKLIRPDAPSTEVNTRFHREAMAIATLESPYAIKLYDFSTTSGGTLYMVMERVRGENLRAVLKREHTIRPKRAARIALQVLEALAEAHSKDILHRDLKPANLMLLRHPIRETVKVLDFGLAKITDVHDSSDFKTAQSRGVGTASYMAPEQFTGQATALSDLYSLGASLYRMLVGRNPFEAADVVGLFRDHRSKPVPPFPPDLEIPVSIENIVRRAMEKAPADRYPSATAMHRALVDVLKGMTGAVEYSSSIDVVQQADDDDDDLTADDVMTSAPSVLPPGSESGANASSAAKTATQRRFPSARTSVNRLGEAARSTPSASDGSGRPLPVVPDVFAGPPSQSASIDVRPRPVAQPDSQPFIVRPVETQSRSKLKRARLIVNVLGVVILGGLTWFAVKSYLDKERSTSAIIADQERALPPPEQIATENELVVVALNLVLNHRERWAIRYLEEAVERSGDPKTTQARISAIPEFGPICELPKIGCRLCIECGPKPVKPSPQLAPPPAKPRGRGKGERKKPDDPVVRPTMPTF